MTAHIKAKKGDFSKIVLMPGDPLRAKWIAENFLENVVEVNNVRGMLAFTGTFNGVKISVMGHGMGIPSIGIYSYELFNFFDVEAIIRIGSAGSYSKDINVGDLVLTKSAYSESTFAELLGVKATNNILYPSQMINDLAKDVANKKGIKMIEAHIHSSDVFYGVRKIDDIVKVSHDAKVVEMESFALFANAEISNKLAACLLTCSDSLVTHEAMSAEDRQTKFVSMVQLALDLVVELDKKI